MSSKHEEMLSLMHSEVAKAARAKLGRELSAVEQSSIERISSLQRLESTWRAFSSAAYSPEQVGHDLLFLSQASEFVGLA